MSCLVGKENSAVGTRRPAWKAQVLLSGARRGVLCHAGVARQHDLGWVVLVITIGLGGVIVDSGYRGRIWGITMESPWGLWWDFSGTSMGLV